MANDMMRQIEMEIAKRKKAREIDIPWWAEYSLETIRDIPARQREAQRYAQQTKQWEMQNVANFEARSDRRIHNANLGGTMYTTEGMAKLKTEIKDMYDIYASKNPEILPEIEDYYDSTILQLNEYTTKNNEYTSSMEKLPVLQESLQKIVGDLSEIQITDFTPEMKIDFRKRLSNLTEDVVRLKGVVNDPYNKGRSDYKETFDSVTIGIVGSTQELLKQINVLDPNGFVMSPEEVMGMENAIFNNDLTDIRRANMEDAEFLTKRVGQYEEDYAGLLKKYEAIDTYSGSVAWETEMKRLSEEYNKMDQDEKDKVDARGDYWTVEGINIEDFPSEGVDAKNVIGVLAEIEKQTAEIDAKYKHDKGYTLSEVLNRPLPWDIPLDKEGDKYVDKDFPKGTPPVTTSITYPPDKDKAVDRGKSEVDQIYMRDVDKGVAGLPKAALPKSYTSSKELTEIHDGKRVVDYDTANKASFDKQQKNLKNVASEKFNTLTKDEKKKHGSVKNYVKNQYEEFLRLTGKTGKGKWGNPEDFIYFYPTKVDANNKINEKYPDANIYRLYHPDAFKGAKKGKHIRLMIRPNINRNMPNNKNQYFGFAQDFDDFRRFLVEGILPEEDLSGNRLSIRPKKDKAK